MKFKKKSQNCDFLHYYQNVALGPSITNENENVIKKLCVFVHKAFIIRSHPTYVENV